MLETRVVAIRNNGNSIVVYVNASVNNVTINANNLLVDGELCVPFEFSIGQFESVNEFCTRVISSIQEKANALASEANQKLRYEQAVAQLTQSLVGQTISTDTVVKTIFIDGDETEVSIKTDGTISKVKKV